MEKYYNKNSTNEMDVAETPLANESNYSQNLESDFPKDNFPNVNNLEFPKYFAIQLSQM